MYGYKVNVHILFRYSYIEDYPCWFFFILKSVLLQFTFLPPIKSEYEYALLQIFCYSQLLPPSAISLWNSLHASLKDLNSVTQFKQNISYLLSRI